MNTSGSANTATGFRALQVNTGSENTATGANVLKENAGSENTATGCDAMLHNYTGSSNTATGFGALGNNRIGSGNTATGVNALKENADSGNTAIGYYALRNNRTGRDNIAVGALAGINLARGDHNIDIGNAGVLDEMATIHIGTNGTHTATFVAGISGATVPTGVAVMIDTDGHLGTIVSSARFKDAIRPMDKTSEAILALKPVTFRYKHDLDPDGIPQFGLVAEDVEKVNPYLVVRDKEGKPYTVRYEAVNAMLLNEFLKAYRKIEEQDSTVAELRLQVQALTAALKEQAAQIRKVSAHLKARKQSPQIALNDQ